MAIIQTGPQPIPNTINARYPSNVGQRPFDKWICFEARSGRHVLRDTIVAERGAQVDRTLGAVGLYMDTQALSDSMHIAYDQAALGPHMGTVVELLAQGGTNLFDTKLGTLSEVGTGLQSFLRNLPANAEEATTRLQGSFWELLKVDMAKLATALPVVEEKHIRAATGQGINPKTDLLFNSQTYREHTFEFSLIPRNINEAQDIDRIISFFQFYSLPVFKRGEQQPGQVGS